MANKYNFFKWTTFGSPYFLRTREGCKFTVANSWDDCWQVQSLPNNLERAWHWEELSREPATANLSYSIAGLVTITQFPLVHRMLQVVEHTDPMEWSNSHLSIRDKFMLAFPWSIYSFLQTEFLFRKFHHIPFQTAPQHFISDGSATFHYYGIRTEMVVTYMDTSCIITGCFSNSLGHKILYFNWHKITQYITHFSQMGSLCLGSNSPRVHEQLI